MTTDMRAIAAQTRAVYERRGELFDRQRAKMLFERRRLEQFAAYLPAGGEVLDVGCGAGEPIAQYFIEAGYRLTGVDVAESLLQLARARFPECTWRQADMRQLSLNQMFDGLIAWHSFFHLMPDEQRATLPKFAVHLKPGGVLMLTVGHEAGEVLGQVGGETVYHSSLSYTEYEQVMKESGLEVLDFAAEAADCDGATILVARKSAGD